MTDINVGIGVVILLLYVVGAILPMLLTMAVSAWQDFIDQVRGKYRDS